MHVFIIMAQSMQLDKAIHLLAAILNIRLLQVDVDSGCELPNCLVQLHDLRQDE